MVRKKLLFVTDGCYPTLTANSEIVYRLADVLQHRYSCDITILSGDLVKPESSVIKQKGFETIFLHSFMKYREIRESTPVKWKQILQLLRYPESFFTYLRIKRNDPHMLDKEYYHAIKRAVRKYKFDEVVCFHYPRNSLRCFLHGSINVPIVAYKLDPWSTRYDIKNRETEKRLERKVDRKLAAIITTDLIREEYKKDSESSLLEKTYALKFPNVIDYAFHQKRINLGDSNTIHCVFVGSVYRVIRNPVYTAKVFNALSKYGIKFHLVGFEYDGKGLLESLPDTVICHGKVSSDEALAYMQSADILVNIGNTILNQMPSKILTYISLGKPIVNFVKNPNCPTLPYMKNYPLALNVMETKELVDEDVLRVRDFILKNRGKHVPFDKIQKIYYDCTPEYVGGKVYEILCRTVGK